MKHVYSELGGSGGGFGRVGGWVGTETKANVFQADYLVAIYVEMSIFLIEKK